MKILLTGAAGFIGSGYLARLNAIGIDQVWLVDTAEHGAGHPNLHNKKFKDFIERRELLDRFQKNQLNDINLVVHLGACADTTQMDRVFLRKNNLEYSQTLATWAFEKGKEFHYASSASVYGDGKKGYNDSESALSGYSPLNPYAESKWLFDRWVVEKKLTNRVVGFRYFNVFGPNEYHKGEMRSMVAKSFDQIKAAGKAKLFGTTRPDYPDGSESRDFIYVKDATKVMAYFLEHPDKHGIFNVGTGKARSFKDLATAVFKALGLSPQIEYVPMPAALRGQYQYFTQADLTHLKKAGYQGSFQSLEESVNDYVQNYLTKPNCYL